MPAKLFGIVGWLLLASLATAHTASAQNPERMQPRISSILADVGCVPSSVEKQNGVTSC